MFRSTSPVHLFVACFVFLQHLSQFHIICESDSQNLIFFSLAFLPNLDDNYTLAFLYLNPQEPLQLCACNIDVDIFEQHSSSLLNSTFISQNMSECDFQGVPLVKMFYWLEADSYFCFGCRLWRVRRNWKKIGKDWRWGKRAQMRLKLPGLKIKNPSLWGRVGRISLMLSTSSQLALKPNNGIGIHVQFRLC